MHHLMVLQGSYQPLPPPQRSPLVSGCVICTESSADKHVVPRKDVPTALSEHAPLARILDLFEWQTYHNSSEIASHELPTCPGMTHALELHIRRAWSRRWSRFCRCEHVCSHLWPFPDLEALARDDVHVSVCMRSQVVRGHSHVPSAHLVCQVACHVPLIQQGCH